MSEIKVGSKLKDNDKRQKGRIVTVTRVDHNGVTGKDFVEYHTGKRMAKIALDRIFTDGKRRQRGFNLIREKTNVAP